MTAPALHLPGLKVVLINLPRSNDRREAMQQRLAELGLTYSLFAAVDGRAEQARLFSQVDVPAFQRHVGRDVLPGEIGCYFSHITVWQQFLDSGEAVLLVLEDDVVFGSDFLAALHEALRVRAHWDFLKLNKIRAKQPISQGRVGPYRLNAYLGTATGLGAYLIPRETALRLLPAMLPITRPIDHELDRIHVHRLRHFGLEPFPSQVRDDNQSTITGQAFNAVKKYRWYARLSVYALRWRNFWGRLFHLLKTGRLFPRSNSL
jgi:glycosyl transferase family 25